MTAIVVKKTRRFALGLLAGTAVLLILVVVAVALLIFALTSSMG